MYIINNCLNDLPELTFDKEELIEYVRTIMKENGDTELFPIEDVVQAEFYIIEFCDNLEFIGEI